MKPELKQMYFFKFGLINPMEVHMNIIETNQYL